MLLESTPTIKYNFFNSNQEEKKYLELTKQIMKILNETPEKYFRLTEFFKKYLEKGFDSAITPNIINLSNVCKLIIVETIISLTIAIYGFYAMLIYGIEDKNSIGLGWGLPLGETVLILCGSAFILPLIAEDNKTRRLNQIKNELSQLFNENTIENVNVEQFLEYLKTNKKAFMAMESVPVLETEICLI